MSLEAAGAGLGSDARSRPRSPFVQFVIDAFGYGAASAAALALDWGLLVLLVRAFHAHYLVAATIAFSAGLAVAYVLSTAFVFRGRAKYRAGGELLGFLITGLVGLALNQALLFGFVDGFAIQVEIAKAPTAVLVFTYNFLSRRFFLFRPASL